jgi:hypothetical protein
MTRALPSGVTVQPLICPAPGPGDLNLRVKKTSGAPIRHAQPSSQKQSSDTRREACWSKIRPNCTCAWIDVSPARNSIRAHRDVLVGMDFFTTEVLTRKVLTTYYVLFFIHLETRQVYLAGFTL